ncbi:MAG: glycosyltransferase family 39 protein [Spirulinaceae cyanobacterium]
MHYLLLTLILGLGAVLRFFNLDLKPLWLDEVITALFSLGKNFNNVPVDVLFSPHNLSPLFRLNPEISCATIANNLHQQSTHPPLFFCLTHSWLTFLSPLTQSLTWKLRAFSALIGVAEIGAVYYLNRLAFSRQVGLVGAGLMATSPFAVYLSQEARHYTLPMFLITLGLICLIKIQQNLQKQQLNPLVWLSWIGVNSLSLYTHYFGILALIAQIITLLCLILYLPKTKKEKLINLASLSLSVLVIIAFFFPWLPILLEHFTSPKTSWLPSPQHILPLLQIIAAWSTTIIVLPVENQPLKIQIISIIFTIAFGVWIAWQTWRGFRQLRQQKHFSISTFTLTCFLTIVLLEFLALVYGLKKDITVVPRYSFIYFPAFECLLAASLTTKKSQNTFPFSVTCIGIISSLFVTFNLAFQKPFVPAAVANHFNQFPEAVLIVFPYDNSLDLALGLSYALALKDARPENRETNFVFLNNSSEQEKLWQKISQLPVSPTNLWLIAPGFLDESFPPSIQITKGTQCNIDNSQFYRLGSYPYQLYRCNIGL